MSDAAWAVLRQSLAERYDEFRYRLTRLLGSEELARETLHETWLHLHAKGDPGTIRNPFAYLLRTALNLASDRKRREKRGLHRFDVSEMLDLVDETPDAAREIEARDQIALLERVLGELTPRRRAILLASRLEGVPLGQIARRLGVSQRYVEIELKTALEYCAKRFDRKIMKRFGPGAGKTSSE
jgi:RNA polymerase sigma-70 factor (ECF subfamily)